MFDAQVVGQMALTAAGLIVGQLVAELTVVLPSVEQTAGPQQPIVALTAVQQLLNVGRIVALLDVVQIAGQPSAVLTVELPNVEQIVVQLDAVQIAVLLSVVLTVEQPYAVLTVGQLNVEQFVVLLNAGQIVGRLNVELNVEQGAGLTVEQQLDAVRTAGWHTAWLDVEVPVEVAVLIVVQAAGPLFVRHCSSIVEQAVL